MNETGRAQAQRNGEALRALLPGIAEGRLRREPARRARARPWRSCAPPWASSLTTSASTTRLKEAHYGHWQGMLAADLPRSMPQGLAGARARSLPLAPAGRRELRGSDGARGRLARRIERDTVVVAHGGVEPRAARPHLSASMPQPCRSCDVPQDRVLVLRRDGMSTGSRGTAAKEKSRSSGCSGSSRRVAVGRSVTVAQAGKERRSCSGTTASGRPVTHYVCLRHATGGSNALEAQKRVRTCGPKANA